MSVSAQDKARAEALGRLAAREGLPVNTCPYQADGDPDQRVLAGRFVAAFVRAGGAVPIDFEDGAKPEQAAPDFHDIEHQGEAMRVAVRRTPTDD